MHAGKEWGEVEACACGCSLQEGAFTSKQWKRKVLAAGHY